MKKFKMACLIALFFTVLPKSVQDNIRNVFMVFGIVVLIIMIASFVCWQTDERKKKRRRPSGNL